jgi:hypothetical protein
MVPALALSPAQLLGQDDAHVVPLEPDRNGVFLHPLARDAFLALRATAAEQGFDLHALSGFRSFARQLAIWNGKARGERELLDAREQPLDVRQLLPAERVEAILRWSALPGCSRHHWGTDLDIIDRAAPGAAQRLLAADWTDGGPFARLDRWLRERIAAGQAMGFFRPYTGVGCAVAAEPWHLSFAPLAARCQAALDPVSLRAALQEADVDLCDEIGARLDDILARHVAVPASLYPAADPPGAEVANR